MNPIILAAIGYFLWQNQKKKAATAAAIKATDTTTPVAVGGSGGSDINDQYAWMYDSDRSAN